MSNMAAQRLVGLLSQDCNFFNNSAESQGGAMFITCYNCENGDNELLYDLGDCSCYNESDDSAEIKIDNSVFKSNMGTNLGGAISIVCGKSEITNTVFEENEATYGGAVSIRYESDLNSIIFDNNDAEWYGGGAYFVCTNHLNLKNSNIGAGVYYEHCGAFGTDNIFNISNVSFSNNYAYFGGSGIGTLVSDFPARKFIGIIWNLIQIMQQWEVAFGSILMSILTCYFHQIPKKLMQILHSLM